MDFSDDTILETLSQLLRRSRTHTAWFDEHPKDGIGGDGYKRLHVVRNDFWGNGLCYNGNGFLPAHSDGHHYIIEMDEAKVVVSDWYSPGHQTYDLLDPASLTEFEKFFGIASVDDPAKPFDPIIAIASMMDIK